MKTRLKKLKAIRKDLDCQFSDSLLNFELAQNPGIYTVKVYSRYKIQALTPGVA